MQHPVSGFRLLALALALAQAVALAGCGVVAAPCRAGSAVVKAVPLVGHMAAAPTDTCADTIDPDDVSKS